MVAVELAGDVIVSTGHVEQEGLVTDSAVTNLTVGHVGQSLVTVITVLLSEVIVGGGMSSATVEPDPVTVTKGQVGQGLETVSVVPVPGMVIAGQVGQGLYTVVFEFDSEIVLIG